MEPHVSPVDVRYHFGNSHASHGSLSFVGAVQGDVHLSHACHDPFREISVPGAAFNSRILQHERTCLPGTRAQLLKEIATWNKDPNGAKIYWLKGMAGTGKTTIARTVAQTFAADGCLGATFFFSRFQDDRNNANKFFGTLAAGLVESFPIVKPHILNVLSKNIDIAERAFPEQWKRLVWGPLSLVKPGSLPDTLTFVVDALDECLNQKDVDLILRIFAQCEPLTITTFRFLFTSRPEVAIQHGFADVAASLRHVFALQDIEYSIVYNDIFMFLDDELHAIARRHSLEDFPRPDQIERLTKRAGKLFIVAATACRFINDEYGYPPDQLEAYLQSERIGEGVTSEIDNMYNVIIERFLDGRGRLHDRMTEYFQKVVGSIISLSNPLSWESLKNLLFVKDGELYPVLSRLHSVLVVPQDRKAAIELLHPSFRDFLLSQERCRNSKLWVNEVEVHANLASSCLRVLSETLKENICELRTPGTLTEEVARDRIELYIPPEIVYASRFWVHHLEHSRTAVCDGDAVHSFLKKHFLHWLETLSLTGHLSESISMVKTLQTITKTLNERGGKNLKEVTNYLNSSVMLCDLSCIIGKSSNVHHFKYITHH